jgi:acetyl-CoA carboxylase biotin carboxyl carrier protein
VKKRARKQDSSKSQADRAGHDMSKNSHLDNEVNYLVELLDRHELAELEVENKGLRIRVRRAGTTDAVSMVTAEQGRPMPGEPAAAAVQTVAPDSLFTVTSPIVGTFYRSPSPDADAYVDEGDFVKKGQVLCIVEAMKLMNEIESEVDGRVHKILAESTKPVEYGQPLFLIDPAAAP